MVLCSSHQKCTHPESQRGKTPTRPRRALIINYRPVQVSGLEDERGGGTVSAWRSRRGRRLKAARAPGAWERKGLGGGPGGSEARGPAGPLQHELPLRTPHCASVRPWGWDERGKRRDGWPCHLCNFSVNLKQV